MNVPGDLPAQATNEKAVDALATGREVVARAQAVADAVLGGALPVRQR
ncbi:MAG: hypothetical protein ABIQ16_02720 [Polyangiaceae bacterium]